MTFGVNGIGYGNTSGIGGGYMPPQNNDDVNDKKDETQGQGQHVETKDVDPNAVYAWMNNNAAFLNIVNNTSVNTVAPEGVVTDPTVADRAVAATENYMAIMDIITQEFGEELAPAVMDLVMDKLMGMV